MSERIVVTGGAGFIGSHVVDALLERGDEVHVVDNLVRGSRANLTDGARFHDVDVADPEALRALRDQIGPVARWFHLAAQIDVRTSVADPTYDAQVNVLGTLHVLAQAARDDAPVTFMSSGGAIFGDGEPPCSDATPVRPLSPYGVAKFAAEEYVAQDARLTGAAHTVIRPSNVYGPRQDPYGEGGVVAIFGSAALEGRPARVFGDGLQTRDFVYVGDVAAATVAASDLAVRGGDGDLRADGDIPRYIVSTAHETTLLELWDAMQRAVGRELGVEHEPAKHGDIYRSALDPGTTRATLEIAMDTSIDDGVAATLRWISGQTPA